MTYTLIEGMQSFNVPVPAREWITSNSRNHWAKQADIVQRLRRRGYLEARRNGILPMSRAHVRVEVEYPKGVRRADPANAYPTIKALIDGFTDFQVFPDDDSSHVVGVEIVRREGACDAGWHVLHFILTPTTEPEAETESMVETVGGEG